MKPGTKLAILFGFLAVAPFILIITSLWLRSAVCRGEIKPEAATLFYYFWPPEDMLDFKVSDEFDITQAGARQAFDFTIKYVGEQEAGILVSRRNIQDLYFDHYQWPLRLRMDFYAGDVLILSTEASEDCSTFLSSRDGVAMFWFEAPKDLPIAKKLRCQATVLVPDQFLPEKYGPIYLYVRTIGKRF